MNPAEKAQNRAESVIEKRLRKVYGNARDEMRKQLTAFEKRTKSLEADMLKKRDRGEITDDELKKWRQYRIFRGENWRSQIDAMTQTLEQSNRVALQIVNGKTSEVFAAGRNYEAYEIESDIGARIGTSFELYDEATVARLLRKQPELLPRRKKLNGQKDRAWNTKNISDTVTSGILQGKSLQEVTQDLAKSLSSTNMKAMSRYAQTAMTGAQNAGRIEAMHTAQDMGIKIRKKWLATLDRRTRVSHQKMDGKVVDIDDEFPNGLQYPGDPDGDPAEVYNCRCTLINVYPEYPAANGKRRDGEGNVLGEMTYKEWEKAKNGIRPFRMEDRTEQKQEAQDWNTITNKITEKAVGRGIAARDIERFSDEVSESEIIARLGGGDKTSGSCMSLAWAYTAEKGGFDVLDFRGGGSCEFFKQWDTISKISKLEGVERTYKSGTKGVQIVNEFLSGMKGKKEYILVTPRHAAIVRNTGEKYEYLELQSKKMGGEYGNGWHGLDDYVLKWRFGVAKTSSHPHDYYSIDVDSLKDNKDFIASMRYLNTAPEKQEKGKSGGLK